MPTPSKAQFSAFRYSSASDQQTSWNSPCSLQVFFIMSAPLSMYSVAGTILRHSGQREPVRRGSPFWSLDGIVTIACSCRLSLYICRTRLGLYLVPHRDILVLSRSTRMVTHNPNVANATTGCGSREKPVRPVSSAPGGGQ